MRKIIQIQDVQDGIHQGYLIALCDDGTIWYLQNNEWELFPNQIPQDKVEIE